MAKKNKKIVEHKVEAEPINLSVVQIQIEYNNELTQLYAYPNDIMTNMILFGKFFAEPKFYEQNILEYIRGKFSSGGTALDIGANIGNHSMFFSKFIFDKTISFEANYRNFAVLCKNKELNNISDDKLELHQVALSDGEYKYSFLEYQDNMGGTKVVEGDVGEILTAKIDSFNLPKVDFIKLDVEGHEVKVLKGAIDLIKRDSPDIMVECNIHEESSFKNVNQYMESIDYHLIDVFRDNQMFYYEHKNK